MFIILIIIVHRCDIFWDDVFLEMKTVKRVPLGNLVDILRGRSWGRKMT